MQRIATPLLLLASIGLHGQVTHELTATNFQFQPPVINAAEGDSLHIIFSPTTHTFTQVDEATWNANGNAPIGMINIGPGVPEITIPLIGTGTMFYVCSPHASMGMKGIVDVALGIEDHARAGAQFLFPDPAQDRVWLRTPLAGPIELALVNAEGQLVEREVLNDEAGLFIGDLPRGLYVVRGYDTQGRIVLVQQLALQ